jgi:predicted phosphohydrolase
MTIQYASDLHLEFPANEQFLKRNLLQPMADVLVLSGDIVPFVLMDKHQEFFSFLSDHFKATYWLPGNHEYYHFDIAQKSGVLHETIRSNVSLVNNTSVVHDHVQLIFSTLWSHISPEYQWQIERSLSDFHVIKNKGYRLSAEKYNQLHLESLEFLTDELNDRKVDQVAVFTHHCPTFLNYPQQYKDSILNEAFAVELYDLIDTSRIDTWVYGHYHSNTAAFQIGDTRLLTNQLGYVQRNEHLLFEPNKVIEI